MNADSHPKIKSRGHMLWRVLAWLDYIVIGAIILVAAGLCGLTLWLTPSRLSQIVDKQASEKLNADVKTGNIAFTFWSTFPHFCIEADSVHVDSRNLRNLSASERKNLPADADFLVSTGRVKGGINVAKLLRGEIWLRDVKVNNLRLNLVAVNDTLNNYTFMPTGGKTKIPYFNVDSLSFVNGGEITYYSQLSRTKAKITLQEASLMPRQGKNDYHLMFKGNIFARSSGFNLLRGFPFELDGDVKVRFNPFGISTTNYAVSLGRIHGRMGMDLDLGDNPRLNSFDYDFEKFSLEDLRSFLPGDDLSMLDRLDAHLSLLASARLTSPYNFSSGYLPSVEVDFEVPRGSVGYTFADNRRYSLDNVRVAGRFLFNGRNPEASVVEIPDISISGLGAELKAGAIITDLMGVPKIEMSLHGHGDLDYVSNHIPELRAMKMHGTADFNIGMKFEVNGRTVRQTVLDADLRADNIEVSIGGFDITARGLKAETDERYAAALTLQASENKIPFDLKFSADNLTLTHEGSDERLTASDVKGDAFLSAQRSGKSLRDARLEFSGSRVGVQANNLEASLSNVKLAFSASELASPVMVPEFQTPREWYADAETMRLVNHTPAFIRMPVPDSFKNLMSRWQISLDLLTGPGNVNANGYAVEIGGLDIDACFDSIVVNDARLKHGITGGDVSARVTNLRQFLASSGPAPVYLTARLNLDTVQINQLAREYSTAYPKSVLAGNAREDAPTGNDSITVALPRNIFGDIYASADETVYTNLHLYDLSTHLTMGNGKVDLDTLHISSDFGQACARFSYDTRDLQNIRVRTSARLYDVDVVSFFENFQKLAEMWPEIKNLSGKLSVGLEAGLQVFPNMSINMPSLEARADIRGSDLKLNQNKFISHLAEMLLIFQEGPIAIDDIRMEAVVHSNLVELFPTTFEVSKYKLVLMGLNNFAGDLYYHVGVEDWPLKIPFGVNIRGNYRDPKLRFGGKSWHDNNGSLIAAGVQDSFRINLMHSVKHYTGEFIHSAATYE